VYKIWKDYINLRKDYFASSDFQNTIHNRILLISNLPIWMNTDKSFTKFIKLLKLPEQPTTCVLNRRTKDLIGLLQAHDAATRKMEYTLEMYFKHNDATLSSKPRPTSHIKDKSGKRVRVDTICHLTDTLHELEARIYDLRARPETDLLNDNAGFVVFRSPAAAHVAAKLLIRVDPARMVTRGRLLIPPHVKLCPPLEDIIWENTGLAPQEAYSRRLVGAGLWLSLMVGWILLIAFITELGDLNSAFVQWGWDTNWLEQNKVAVLFWQGFVVPSMLGFCSLILPKILAVISRIQGVMSVPGVMKSVLYKYFIFQMIQVLTTFFSSLFNSIRHNNSDLKQNFTNATIALSFVSHTFPSILFNPN
jgi:calcium permeable stress-gated cation channel